MNWLGFALLIGAVSAPAQSTWQGLQFGQSRAEAAQVLAAKKAVLNAGSSPQTATVTPDLAVQTSSPMLSANLRAEVANAPMYFTPVLSFDDGDKLKAITLTLDETKTFQATTELKGTKPLLTFIAGTSLYEQLSSKYGAPNTANGPCSDISLASLVGATTECNARWGSNGQTIELHWDYRSILDSLNFTVIYKPLPSAL
jgi:hypothetical protein